MLQIIPHYTDAKRQKEAFAQLAEIVEQAEEVQETEEISGETKETENQALLKKYQKLYSQNQDMAGWIFIDDTPINYPVFHMVAV